MTDSYTALVLGATGLVGQALTEKLLADRRYSQVTCLLRRPMQGSLDQNVKDKLQPVVIDFEQMDSYQGYFNVDHVYVCLGTTIKKARSREAFRKVDFEYVHAAAQIAGLQGCKSFVWVSSVGADANSRSFYLRVKGELENAIVKMPMLKNASAVRPSLLLGKRDESRFLEQLGGKVSPLISPLFIGRLEKYRPVGADKVAQQMIQLQVF